MPTHRGQSLAHRSGRRRALTVARASKVCSKPGCPHLQPCPDHPKIPWAGSSRRHELPRDWKSRIVPRILARDPVCTRCRARPSTEVHHIDDRHDHRDSNLAGVCADCHGHETQRQAAIGRRRSART